MTTRRVLSWVFFSVAGCAGRGPAVVVAPSEPAGSSSAPAVAAVSDASSFVADAQTETSAAAGLELRDAAPTATASDATPRYASACAEQVPQEFLIRGHFLKEGPEGNLRAIQYRTEQYGYFKGFGHPGPGALPPSAFLEDTLFMGLHVKMHRKVVPALACVEAEIERACGDYPYKPHALAGIRYRNTYRGGEVTNHAYGIAIDVDPAENTCCGCVKPWNDAPVCKRPAKTEYDRMRMPECWVHAFERFGFYWLGHDVLRDTMHFEFLGDPEKIRPKGANSATSSAPVRGADGGG